MAPYMVKFKKTRKIIIFLAYEHRMPVVMLVLERRESASPRVTQMAPSGCFARMNLSASSLALLLLESMIFLWDGSGRIRERICENIDLQPVANKISSWASDWHFVKKMRLIYNL